MALAAAATLGPLLAGGQASATTDDDRAAIRTARVQGKIDGSRRTFDVPFRRLRSLDTFGKDASGRRRVQVELYAPDGLRKVWTKEVTLRGVGWERAFPWGSDWTNTVHMAGKLVDDLKAAGVEPLVSIPTRPAPPLGSNLLRAYGDPGAFWRVTSQDEAEAVLSTRVRYVSNGEPVDVPLWRVESIQLDPHRSAVEVRRIGGRHASDLTDEVTLTGVGPDVTVRLGSPDWTNIGVFIARLLKYFDVKRTHPQKFVPDVPDPPLPAAADWLRAVEKSPNGGIGAWTRFANHTPEQFENMIVGSGIWRESGVNLEVKDWGGQSYYRPLGGVGGLSIDTTGGGGFVHLRYNPYGMSDRNTNRWVTSSEVRLTGNTPEVTLKARAWWPGVEPFEALVTESIRAQGMTPREFAQAVAARVMPREILAAQARFLRVAAPKLRFTEAVARPSRVERELFELIDPIIIPPRQRGESEDDWDLRIRRERERAFQETSRRHNGTDPRRLPRSRPRR